ncbi:PAS domain S-box [Catenovulum agarivorans DS-2]|uniref:histidine kinase n=1 Tax=Catenovulum agarivorans DS-2 TaxID=1328313 RepID=W7QDE3_9ALTE|nr:ATP-binding protein [Catenovulum agarivorans]EWH10924.1 PAS domain S-box [Catenovulum agarivorans DS-2]
MTRINSRQLQRYHYSNKFFIALATLCITLIIAASIWLAHFNFKTSYKSYRSELSESLSFTRANLEASLAKDLLVTRSIRSYIATNPELDQAEFSSFVQQLVVSDNHVRNVGAAKDLVLNLIHPLKGNEAALGLDFRKNPAQRDAALKAVKEKSIVIAGPLNLVQGGVALVAREPVFSAQSGQLWGLVSVVIDIDRLLANADISNHPSLDIALRTNAPLTSNEKVFFGDPQLFNQDGVLTTQVNLPYGSWFMAAYPQGGWAIELFPLEHIWLTAIIVSLVILLFVYLYKNQQQKAVYQRERLLSEKRLRAIFEDNQTIMMLFDCDSGDIVEFNPAACQYYGFSQTQLSAKSIQELGNAELSEYLACLEEDKGSTAIFTHTLAQGQLRQVEIQLSPLELDNIRVAVAVIKDVTEQLRFAEALQQATRQAEQASQAKSQFLANMSHEIRTPMNGILGLADLCLATELNNTQLAYLRKIKLSADNLLHVINDILDYSKIEAGKLSIVEEDFCLDSVVQGVAASVGHFNLKPDVLCLFDLGCEPLPKVVGDPNRLHQVLVNLLSNAIKFTEAGHVILQIRLVANECNDKLQIEFSVNDSGIGIPVEQQQALFAAFSQADGSTSRKYGGTGLGLAISQNLVKLMGGTIQLTSEAGCGSSFYFKLEFAKSHRQNALYIKRSEHALAVIADPLEQTIFSQYAVNVFQSCQLVELEDLLSSCYQVEPEFVFLDLALGETQIAELLRQTNIPTNCFVLLVARLDGQSAAAMKRLNIHTYLLKPYSLGNLVSVLEQSSEPVDAHQPSTSFQSKLQTLEGRKKILLAEDNEINAEIAIALLTQQGFEVVHAINGSEALELIDQSFALVLMDVQMPEMDGLTATKLIRQQYTAEQLPIVAMTAHVMPDEISKCQQAGMDAHIGKPFGRQQLFDTIDQLLCVE